MTLETCTAIGDSRTDIMGGFQLVTGRFVVGGTVISVSNVPLPIIGFQLPTCNEQQNQGTVQRCLVQRICGRGRLVVVGGSVDASASLRPVLSGTVLGLSTSGSPVAIEVTLLGQPVRRIFHNAFHCVASSSCAMVAEVCDCKLFPVVACFQDTSIVTTTAVSDPAVPSTTVCLARSFRQLDVVHVTVNLWPSTRHRQQQQHQVLLKSAFPQCIRISEASPAAPCLTINGDNLDRAVALVFNGNVCAELLAVQTHSVTVRVPCALSVIPSSGTLSMLVTAIDAYGRMSNAIPVLVNCCMCPQPVLISATPTTVSVGTVVTILGTGLSSAGCVTVVTIGGVAATPSSISSTSIVVTVPGGALCPTLTVVVTLSSSECQRVSNSLTLTCGSLCSCATPIITSATPPTVAVGDLVTITGTGLSSAGCTTTVSIGGVATIPLTTSPTVITVTVPVGVSCSGGPLAVVVTVSSPTCALSDSANVTCEDTLGGVFGTDAGTSFVSSLFTIDPATGAATLVGVTGFTRVSAIAIDPVSRTLYGVADTGGFTFVLIRINKTTGTGILVGPTLIVGHMNVSDMSFDPQTGVLYAASQDPGPPNEDLYRINVSSGLDTFVGTIETGTTAGSALSFDRNVTPTLYFLPLESLYTVNPGSGLGTFQSAVTFVGAIAGSVNAMDFSIAANTFYTSILDIGSTHLFGTLNVGTNTVTVVGPTVNNLDGLAVDQ